MYSAWKLSKGSAFSIEDCAARHLADLQAAARKTNRNRGELLGEAGDR
jgi:hypothetical protein